MTYADEAIGITHAATATDIPVAISFTVETDGRLPSGQALGEAIQQVDDETDRGPACYMINCAYPTHFERVLGAGEPWQDRIRGMRANASTKSHAELDEATDLTRAIRPTSAPGTRSSLPSFRSSASSAGAAARIIGTSARSARRGPPPRVGGRATTDERAGSRPKRARRDSGGGGIRTRGPLSRTPVFKTGALNRSATPPSGTVALHRADAAGRHLYTASRSFQERWPSG